MPPVTIPGVFQDYDGSSAVADLISNIDKNKMPDGSTGGFPLLALLKKFGKSNVGKAAGTAVGGSLLSSFLNKDAQRAAESAQEKLGKVADSEAALNNLTVKELTSLFADIAKAQGNPQVAFTFERFQENPQAFMDSVMNMTGFNMRSGLLGNRGIQGGATSQLAGLTGADARAGAQAGGSLVQSLVSSLLLQQMLGGNQQNPFNDPSTLGTGARIFR
jgi:hypothetical protein